MGYTLQTFTPEVQSLFLDGVAAGLEVPKEDCTIMSISTQSPATARAVTRDEDALVHDEREDPSLFGLPPAAAVARRALAQVTNGQLFIVVAVFQTALAATGETPQQLFDRMVAMLPEALLASLIKAGLSNAVAAVVSDVVVDESMVDIIYTPEGPGSPRPSPPPPLSPLPPPPPPPPPPPRGVRPGIFCSFDCLGGTAYGHTLGNACVWVPWLGPGNTGLPASSQPASSAPVGSDGKPLALVKTVVAAEAAGFLALMSLAGLVVGQQALLAHAAAAAAPPTLLSPRPPPLALPMPPGVAWPPPPLMPSPTAAPVPSGGVEALGGPEDGLVRTDGASPPPGRAPAPPATSGASAAGVALPRLPASSDAMPLPSISA